MSSTNDYKIPAKVEELFNSTAGSKFAGLNSAKAGAREEKSLEEGSAPVQLYSLFTPNGQKVGILLEELEIDYDAHVINIMKGDQFTSGFVNVNLNSKIPAVVDRDGPGGQPISLFESGSILLYFAEKYKKFIPTDPAQRQQCLNWLFWQMSAFGPFIGQFVHFFIYVPADKHETIQYGLARYGMEFQRLLSVLDQRLSTSAYLAGDEYSIADIAVFAYFHGVHTGFAHPSSGQRAADFLSLEQYPHAIKWCEKIMARPAVQRGLQVCHANGQGKPWLVPAAAGDTNAADH